MEAHIARGDDWGSGTSASAINGAPYHMRQIDWNLNNLGNQDMALNAGAVFSTGTVIIEKIALGDDNTFDYQSDGAGMNDLTDPGNPVPLDFSITTDEGFGERRFEEILSGPDFPDKTVTELTGSRSATREMKMTLSMPSTVSSAVKVKSAPQI